MHCETIKLLINVFIFCVLVNEVRTSHRKHSVFNRKRKINQLILLEK